MSIEVKITITSREVLKALTSQDECAEMAYAALRELRDRVMRANNMSDANRVTVALNRLSDNIEFLFK